MPEGKLYYSLIAFLISYKKPTFWFLFCNTNKDMGSSEECGGGDSLVFFTFFSSTPTNFLK